MKKLFLFAVLILSSAQVYGDDFVIEDISFFSSDTRLAGSIVLPINGKIQAAVVFVHGSGPQERSLGIGKRFAAEGIAALVYDKRGVGRSGGTYERNQSVSGQNIKLLAADAQAAIEILRAHPSTASVPLGLTGISQAGWIVPVAATQVSDVDFMVLWSGPVCRVSEEDIYSKYTRDLDSKRVPSYAEALHARTTPYIWPDFLGEDTAPTTSLATLDIPGLWVFGEQDGSVPVDLSIDRLNALIDTGKPYEYAFFSRLGHNNMHETFSMVTDWIKRTTQQ